MTSLGTFVRSAIMPTYVMTRLQFVWRLGLVLAFSALVYARFFTPFPPGTPLDQAVADAARLGRPLQIYIGPHPVPDRGADASQFQLIDGNDYAAGITISVVSMIGNAIRHGYQVKADAGVIAFFVLLLLFGLILVMPPLPPLTSILALTVLYRLTRDHGGTAFVQGSLGNTRWLMAWMPLLVAVYFLFFTFQHRRSAAYWIVLAGYAFAISYLTLWREELLSAAYIFIAASFALFAIVLTAILTARRVPWMERRADSVSLAKGMLPVGMLIGAIVVTKCLLFVLFASATGKPLAETHIPTHGQGLPLYLGLGFSDNPFNISWQDETGSQHFLLMNTAPNTVPITWPFVGETLGREWIRLVLAEPFEFARSIWSKAAFLHRLYLHPRIDASNALMFMGGLTVPPYMTAIYVTSVLALGVLFVLAATGEARDVALCIGALGIFAGGCGAALLIYPGYPMGATSALLTLSLLLLPQCLAVHYQGGDWLSALTDGKEYDVRKVFLSAIGIALAAGVSWLSLTTAKNWCNERRVVEAPAPEAIQRMDLSYAWYFNRLPVSDQERVIARLYDHHDPRVFRGPQRTRRPVTSALDWYQPIVGIKWEKGFNLVAFMSKEWRRTEAEIDQGRVNTRIQFAAQGPRFGKLEYLTGADLTFATMIDVNDASWRDVYKMISVPIAKTFGDAGAIEVNALMDLTSYTDTKLIGKAVLTSADGPDEERRRQMATMQGFEPQ